MPRRRPAGDPEQRPGAVLGPEPCRRRDRRQAVQRDRRAARPDEDADPHSRRARNLCRPLHRRADARAEPRHARPEPGHAPAGRAFRHLRVPDGPVRVIFDVSPLSHPRTGIGNYILGSLSGLVAAAGDEHEIVAFAPTSPRGRRAIPEALSGVPVELRLRVLPFSHRARMAWSRRGSPPLERFLGTFDALHFTDWMYPPQAGGVRATTIHDLVPLRFPEWVTPRTREMHGEKYANAARTCDVIFANSAYTAADVVELLGVPRERIRVAPPGVGAGYAPDGGRADLGAPYVLGVGTLEPRKNLKRLVEAWAQLSGDYTLAL